MAFEVEVAGRPTRTLNLLLRDLVGPESIRARGNALVLSVGDQAALVSLVAHLNDLGLAIESVARVDAVETVAGVSGPPG